MLSSGYMADQQSELPDDKGTKKGKRTTGLCVLLSAMARHSGELPFRGLPFGVRVRVSVRLIESGFGVRTRDNVSCRVRASLRINE